jgi:hypothetical protein
VKRPPVFVQWLRWLLGLLLLPVLVVEAMSAWSLLRNAPPTHEMLAFCLGFIFWVLVFHGLLRPFRAYVLAHELSHAIWGFLSGASVTDLRVSHKGGSVQLSEAGLFVTLAPYFLPLYTLLILLLFGVFSLFFDPTPWFIPWMAALGASWGFHVTFTLSITLDSPQPDLREYGYFFSSVLILIINAGILLVTLVLLGSMSWADLGRALQSAASAFLSLIRQVI